MPAEPARTFPPDFVWGAATASYQIEGAVHEDGRSESIWDRFAHTPGKVRNDETGDVACDFYHRYRADVALMRELGIDAFRFSIAWPRVIPEPRGAVNEKGLDFYDRLVDELLANGVEPCATLYHWDLPQAIEDEGGWTSRDIVEVFVEYVEPVVDRLGDRVKRWITHNEPWVVAWLGYGFGKHAPGRASREDAVRATHHLLLSHGRAVEVIRREVSDAEVGITLNLGHVEPATPSDADRAAAREADGFGNRLYLDPLYRAEYPADVLERLGPAAPPVEDGDMELIAIETDFLGVNTYARSVVEAGPDGRPVHQRVPGSVYTAMDWEVYPDALQKLLVRVRDDYAPPAIYVTENGAAFDDVRDHEGRVRDPERQAYIAGHIASVGGAIDQGVPVKGYFVWSLLDNFEWAHGYSKRFGLVYVDYPTLARVPKDSFYWYRDFIANRPKTVRPSPLAPVAGA